MATFRWIHSYRIKAICALLCAGCWWLPVFSFALGIAPSYPPVFMESASPVSIHLVLRQTTDQLQLWTREGELLSSLAQARKVIINNPQVKSLTLDFRSGHFNIPIIYHGNRQRNAQLIIQGGHFPLLKHVLQEQSSGYLDLDENGQADVAYNNVAEVHLLVDANSEIRIETPAPYAPTQIQRVKNPPMYRVSSKENAFPSTLIPPGHIITLQSPALI